MCAPQLSLRIGLAHEIEPLSDEEAHDFLDKWWSHRIMPSADDFTDSEAIAAILVCPRGIFV